MIKRILETLFYAAVKHLPVKARIVLLYFKSFRRLPNLRRPRTFTEKCQALKLADAPLGPYVNKVTAKDFVRDRVGATHVIPTLYHGPTLPPREERNWPLPYVIKANHGSGGNIFVRETPDWDAIERAVATFLAFDFSQVAGDLYYSTFPREVLVEPFISPDGELPLDYSSSSSEAMSRSSRSMPTANTPTSALSTTLSGTAFPIDGAPIPMRRQLLGRVTSTSWSASRNGSEKTSASRA